MFDYFGVLISVILGLALTHVLRRLAKLIQMRREAIARGSSVSSSRWSCWTFLNHC